MLFIYLFYFIFYSVKLLTDVINSFEPSESSSPITTPKKSKHREQDLLINNFNCLIEHESINTNKQSIPFTSSVQNLFIFGSDTQQQQQQCDENEEEILRNLLIKLKKFSNKLNKSTTKKRNRKIKRKKLVYNKKKRVFKSIDTKMSPKVVNASSDTPIKKCKNSNKIKKLLNDSRGIAKYMIDYDISELTSPASSSIINTSAINTTATKQIFDNTFDNRQFELQFENLEQQIDSLDKQQHQQQQQQVIKLEYSFSNNDTLVKSNCSSGYLSDF